jgi:hypothetical protein
MTMNGGHRTPRATLVLGAAALGAMALVRPPLATPALAQQAIPLAAVRPAVEPRQGAAAALPFFAGERLEYRVRVARMGDIGQVTMRVDGPEAVRGVETLVLHFDFTARVGPVRAEDRTASWLDPQRMRALRFQKRERHPLARHDEAVELDPDRRRWTDAEGRVGESPTDRPLDELSFMYFVRTLPLAADTAFDVSRHFDPERSPTSVRVVGRRIVATAAGTFNTVRLELRVRDPRRYKGEGVIRLDVTDDECRIPVRIESRMPVVGTAVMTLAAQNHGAMHH